MCNITQVKTLINPNTNTIYSFMIISINKSSFGFMMKIIVEHLSNCVSTIRLMTLSIMTLVSFSFFFFRFLTDNSRVDTNTRIWLISHISIIKDVWIFEHCSNAINRINDTENIDSYTRWRGGRRIVACQNIRG